MLIAKTLSFYKKREVQEALVEQATNKEVSVNFSNKYFSKRPDALFTGGDVLEFAKKKGSSFHCSEELWSNPLHIKTGMTKKEIAEIRTGWDLILDIDCPYWPLSKLITHLFVQALTEHGITSTTVKFSGNKGFHIAVPFEAFPETFNGQATKDLFPEAPRRIAHYLLDFLATHYVEDKGEYLLFDKKFKEKKEDLAQKLGLESKEAFIKQYWEDAKGNRYDINDNPSLKKQDKTIFLCNSCGYTMTEKTHEDVRTCPQCGMLMKAETMKKPEGRIISVFDPLTIIEVDTILIAHRHLYRMPYSFHEKSALISVPLPKENILQFSKEDAQPEKVNFTVPFLNRNVKRGEATKLLIAAYDYNPDLSSDDEEKKEYEIPKEALPEEFFPPCIKIMLEGLKDGRKRALFTIINFLRGAGWSLEQIEDTLTEWNKLNDEPLREVTIKGRIRYEKTKKEPLPPHNCKRYYQDFGVCKPDENCNRIKNPLQYAKNKAKDAGFGVEKKGRAKLTEEQKEMRRKHREKMKQEQEES